MPPPSIKLSIDLSATIERYVKYRELEHQYEGLSLPEIATMEYVTLVYNEQEDAEPRNSISLDALQPKDVQRKEFFKQLAVIKTRVSKFATTEVNGKP